MTREPSAPAPRGTSPETLFMQPSDMRPGAPQPCLRWVGRLPLSPWGLRQVHISPGLQKWVPDPSPLDVASPEPVSRPHCLLDCFAMCSVFRRDGFRGVWCVGGCPLPSPPAAPPRGRGGSGGCVCPDVSERGDSLELPASFSVVDRVCVVACFVPVFVYENQNQSPFSSSLFLFGTWKQNVP